MLLWNERENFVKWAGGLLVWVVSATGAAGAVSNVGAVGPPCVMLVCGIRFWMVSWALHRFNLQPPPFIGADDGGP